jgi:hypothetical protein
MKYLPACINAIVILGAFLFAFPCTANAYIDPGSGSYILQLALALIFGSLFAIKLFWSRIKGFLKRLFSRGEKP